MPDLFTIADLPRALDDTDLPTIRMVVAKLGSYQDKRYGAFAITDKHLAGWQRNLAELPDGQAPIDFDHSPEKGQGSKAAGWITSLERRTGADLQAEDPKRFARLDPAAVYAASTVELSRAGAQAVRDREYRYISPTFVDDWADEHGAKRGPALIGAGMTNRPFLKRGMPAISLSEDDFQAPAEETPHGSDSRGRMSLTAIAKALGIANPEAATEATILEAFPGDTAGGVKILAADEYAGLIARAAAGDAATTALAETKFESAWKRALEDPAGPRVTPAQETDFKALAEVNLDLAVKTLDGLPHVALNTRAKGDPTPPPGGGAVLDGVDEDRQGLHERAMTKLLADGVDEGHPDFADKYVGTVRSLEAADAR